MTKSLISFSIMFQDFWPPFVTAPSHPKMGWNGGRVQGSHALGMELVGGLLDIESLWTTRCGYPVIFIMEILSLDGAQVMFMRFVNQRKQTNTFSSILQERGAKLPPNHPQTKKENKEEKKEKTHTIRYISLCAL